MGHIHPGEMLSVKVVEALQKPGESSQVGGYGRWGERRGTERGVMLRSFPTQLTSEAVAS